MQDPTADIASKERDHAIAWLARAVAGAVTFSLIGGCLHGMSMQHSPLLKYLILAWAMFGAAVGAVFGRTPLRGKALWILLGIPGGLALGLAVAWGYAIINTLNQSPHFFEKTYASYVNQAIRLTLPAGLIFGMSIGWVIGMWQANKRSSESR